MVTCEKKKKEHSAGKQGERPPLTGYTVKLILNWANRNELNIL